MLQLLEAEAPGTCVCECVHARACGKMPILWIYIDTFFPALSVVSVPSVTPKRVVHTHTQMVFAPPAFKIHSHAILLELKIKEGL